MKKLSSPVKAVIIMVLVLLLVMFYESKRIETFSFGIENSFLRSLALSYVSASEKIKASLGLMPFFGKEETFWTNIKQSPKIFNYNSQTNQIIINPESSQLPYQPLRVETPYNILIVGDSFIIEGFGPTLEKELLLYKETEVYRKGVYSTGLSRPDYFNWEEEINKLIVQNTPNVAIVMFGANDGQDIRTLDKKIIHYGTDDWNTAYANKVANFIKILNNNKIFVFWVGNPIARDKYYLDKMANLNSIYRAECQKSPDCLFISTWSTLTGANGKYSAYLPDENGRQRLARASDGIHPTSFGSKILVKEVMAKIKEKIKLEKL